MYVVDEESPRELLYRALLAEQPSLPLTPELKQIAQEASSLVHQYRTTWYQLGALYARAEDRHLAEKAGMKVEVFWIHNVPSDVGIRAVQAYARISRAFPPTIASTPYSWGCLDRLIVYAQRNKIRLPDDPGSVMISWTQDGRTLSKRFADCQERDLNAALGRGPKPAQPLPTVLEQCLAYVRAQLEGELGPECRLDASMKKGTPWVSLAGRSEKFFLVCSEISDAVEEFASQHAPKLRRARAATKLGNRSRTGTRRSAR
jgi:hypothetical protein